MKLEIEFGKYKIAFMTRLIKTSGGSNQNDSSILKVKK